MKDPRRTLPLHTRIYYRGFVEAVTILNGYRGNLSLKLRLLNLAADIELSATARLYRVMYGGNKGTVTKVYVNTLNKLHKAKLLI